MGKTRRTETIKRNDYVSTTKPDDPGAVPAFETSLGLPRTSGASKPVYANETALANFNKNVDPAVLKHQIEAANVAALFAKKALRPDEIAALRRRFFDITARMAEFEVEQVMKGEKQWSNQQVRLFGMLLERVMPKMSSITIEDKRAQSVEDLSVEELEAIVMGKKKGEAIDVIAKKAGELDAQADKEEMRDYNRMLIKKAGHITSVDEAEKKFVEKKKAPPGSKKKSSDQPLHTQPHKGSPTSTKESDATDAASVTSGSPRE